MSLVCNFDVIFEYKGDKYLIEKPLNFTKLMQEIRESAEIATENLQIYYLDDEDHKISIANDFNLKAAYNLFYRTKKTEVTLKGCSEKEPP